MSTDQLSKALEHELVKVAAVAKGKLGRGGEISKLEELVQRRGLDEYDVASPEPVHLAAIVIGLESADAGKHVSTV